MDFNSLLFLLAFLPIVVGLYWLTYALEGQRRIASRVVLLTAGIVFYLFNSSWMHLGMLAGVSLFHYLMCLWMEKLRKDPEGKSSKGRKALLIIDVSVAVGLLVFFKYAGLFPAMRSLAFPLALSFVTFQTISFTVDVYRGTVEFKKVSLFSYFLYIFLFFKLIEGPITPYNRLQENKPGFDKLFDGVVRFCYGLAKKVLIADTLAVVVSSHLGEVAYIGTGLSWLTILSYTLQLYFDFSGYCDMGIGIGKMLGYDLPENFNNPYLSTSIRDFWRRWHISLSAWFKSYVYIPLGGNRKGQGRTLLNLLIIFILTGLWHGSTANFLLWGLFFGFFMVAERLFLGKYLDKNPVKFFSWLYAILVVMMGWVLFICPDVRDIGYFFRNLFSYQPNLSSSTLMGALSLKVILALSFGIAFATFVPYLLNRFFPKRGENPFYVYGKAFIGVGLLVLSMVVITISAHAPSLYGGF